ncbi:hypothetical protein Tco_0639944 [Tanacetum coccineum]
MIRCRSEVEEAVRMISSAYSSHCRESERLRIVRMIAGSRRAWKGDLGIGEELGTCKLYLGLAFIIPNLERVSIGCCEVGGGGGGVVGDVGVVCGDGVDKGVGGVDCGVVKAPISTMIVRVPEKDRWCGTRGKDVIADGGGGEDIKHGSVEVLTAHQIFCEVGRPKKNVNSDLRKGHSIYIHSCLEDFEMSKVE